MKRAILAAVLAAVLLPLAGCKTSERGLTVRPVSDKGAFVRQGGGYALVVGISEYADPDIPDLKYAHRDALAWRDFFLSPRGGAFRPEQVRCLTNEQATRGNIINSISGFLNAAGPEDLVIVFFAGHGTPEHRKKTIPYLLCHDSRPGRYASTAIEMTDLKRKLEDYVNSQRVIVIADACHSAGTEGWQKGVRAASGDVADYWKKMSSSECGRSAVTASRVGELSREALRWGGGHGVFSFYMLGALRGETDDRGGAADHNGDGFVTLSEAFDWARPRVERDTNYAQHPFGSAYVDDSIPLGVLNRALVDELAKRVKTTPGVTPVPAAPVRIVVPARATAMPPSYSGKLTREQGDLNFALALYNQGKVNDAMRRFQAIIENLGPCADRAMLARLAHLLKAGEYGAARSVALEVGARFPGSPAAKDAASRIAALDAAVARAKYDNVLRPIAALSDPEQRIAKLQAWVNAQEQETPKQRSPHVADARRQIAAWQAEIARERRGRYAAAVAQGQALASKGDYDAAIKALQEARLHTNDTTEADRLIRTAAFDRDYRAALTRAKARPDLAESVASLSAWASGQEGLDAASRNPHLPEAGRQIETWRRERARNRAAAYKDALAKGQAALERDPSGAIRQFETASGLADNDFDKQQVKRLLTMARSRLTEKQQRDAYADAAARERRAKTLEGKLRVWQAYLKGQRPGPLADRADLRLKDLKRQLVERFAADHAAAMKAADEARAAKRFTQASLAVLRARRLLNEAGTWGFEMTSGGLKALDALSARIATEEKTHRQDQAWASARRSAEAELSGGVDERAFDRALKGYQGFVDRNPDNPHAAEARKRMTALREERTAWIGKEITRQLASATTGLGAIEALAMRAERGENVDAAHGDIRSVRASLERAKELTSDRSVQRTAAGLAVRLDRALTQFNPYLEVTAKSAKTRQAVAASVYVNGTKQGTTPTRIKLAKGRRYAVEVRYDKHQSHSETITPQTGGLHKVDATLKYAPYPRGWTAKTRRVKVMTPAGEEAKEITYYKNPLGMQFVKVPAGEFRMGSPDGESKRDSDEGPVHRVRITHPFFLQAHEVTQRQWEQVMGSNPSNFKGANRPVEQVSWDDAQAFIKKLCAKENPAGAGYRLPTEAEWEYACRAGSRTPFYTGETISTDLANYDGNYTYGNGRKGQYRRQTTDVGSFLPNAFGLYDMTGNVWEWCSDWYEKDYYSKSPSADPEGPTSGTRRVCRGGSWLYGPWYCRSAGRDRVAPGGRGDVLGFRVSLSPPRP